jgi:hypothetical protein
MKKVLVTILLLLFAQVAYAEYINGVWVDPQWVKLHEVRTLKVVMGIPRQKTESFRSNQRQDLAMQTKRWDKKPSVMTELTTDTLFLDRPRRVSLAGDAGGGKGWRIDNILLVEVLDHSDNVIKQGMIGRLADADQLLSHGKRMAQYGPNSMIFSGKQVDIGPLLPVKKPFKLKVSALDYGEFGEVTDVYLIVE